MEAQLHLQTLDGRESTLQARREPLSQHERVTRTMWTTMICWIFAGITALIPLLHFVLTPGFFLLGIVLGLRSWMRTEAFRDAEGPCPSCGGRLFFALLIRTERHKEICPHCRHSFLVRFE